MVEILYESEYVKVVDFGNLYVLEDKVRLAFPRLGRQAFDTGGEYVFADVVETPDGHVGVCRWYIPKDLRNPEDKKNWVLQKAVTLSMRYERGMK
jgi:hypothetical protein